MLHALNGNIAWRMIAAVALAPIVLKVEQGAVEMVGDVSTAVSVAVQDIVDESRMVVMRTISVAGAFVSVVLLMVAAVIVWFISRTILTRLVHYVTGNPSQVSAELGSYNNGEAVYKVQGKLGVHKVFVQGGPGACGCKAFINEGACGHVDAALLTHQQLLGRSNLGVRFTSVPENTASVPEEPETIRRGLSALGDPRATGTPSRCFQGIAQKARGSCFGFSSAKARDEEKHTKPPTTKSTATASVGVESLTELASEGKELPTDSGDPARSVRVAAPSSRNRVSSASRGKGQSVDPDGTDSFDQPDLVRALVAASEARVRLRLVCDLGQATGLTSMQLQVLQELTTAGCDCRLATGRSVH